MKRTILIGILVWFVFACTRTENGLVFGVPDYEKRDAKVARVDLDILLKVDEILSDKDTWAKDAARVCGDTRTYSLYCALEKATIEVVGSNVHRQAALQEVRFAVDDYYKNRWEVHRLADFNAHPDTTFQNVKSIIRKSISTVREKLYLAPSLK